MVDTIGNLVLYRTPSKAVIKNRRKFYALRKKRGESTGKWLERIRTHAIGCEFLTFTEYALIDKFVCGLNNEEIEAILNTDTWTLNLLNESFANRVNRAVPTAVNAVKGDQKQAVLFDIVKCESVSTLKRTLYKKNMYLFVVVTFISYVIQVDFEYYESILCAEIDKDEENIDVQQQPNVIAETNTSLEEDFDPNHEIPIDVLKSEVVSFRKTAYFQFQL